MSTNFVIPFLNSKSPNQYEDFIIMILATAYGNKGIPIPIVEGLSFVDAGVQFGTVW